MTPEPTTETCIETYLRRATRGLWGKRRLEVREELAAHLEARVLSYQLAGYDEMGALGRALSEMGNPREVSLGMAKLYTFPKIAGSGLAFAALCVLTLAVWPHTIAQGVKSIFYYPTTECVRALEPGSKVPISQECDLNTFSDVWLERQELVQTLQIQGVKVTGAETLTLTFPKAQSVSIRAGAPGNLDYDIKPADSSYVALSSLLYVLQNQVRVSVEGWDNPRVHFGEAVIQVGSNKRLVPGSTFYRTYLNTFVRGKVTEAANKQSQTQDFLFTPREDYWMEGYDVKEQALEVIAKPGEVYGVIAILDPELPAKLFSDESENPNEAFFADTAFTTLSTDVARVAQGGTLELYLPEEPLKFVKSLGAQPIPGTAVLVRLSGSDNKLGYEIVSPEQIRYQASKYEAQKP